MLAQFSLCRDVYVLPVLPLLLDTLGLGVLWDELFWLVLRR